ncbi:MAG: toprim domain-containing protein, partial [Ruminococcus sp.]|nr:toprim domain-containing protein [Ruminococcus sp.]
MNDLIENLKPFLLDYVDEITTPSKNGSKNQYICPLCDSGTGKNRSGAFTIYPDTHSYYCFSCGASGDIFNLYGAINNISEFSAIANDLKAKYGVSSAQPIRYKEQPARHSQSDEKDYTKFFYVAEQHLHETDYLTNRGLSIETQRKFRCGYIPAFTYKNNQTTPAVIIPTSEHSFSWRSTTENIKQKRGTAHILNTKALNSPYCFIVEGEIDCMSVDECGFACIGLGSVSNIKKIFNCDISKTVLILALDNDKAGSKATVELEKLCQENRTPYITAHNVWENYKDANEMLVSDRQTLIRNLHELSERALSLDKDKWLIQLLTDIQSNSEWKDNLKRNLTDNAVKNFLNNIYLILSNDEKYKGKIAFNELKQMRSY